MNEDGTASQGFEGFGDNPQFLRLIFDVSPNLIFVKDRQGRFVFANKALADVYRTDVKGLIGKTDADFDPEITEIEHFLADDLHVMNSLQERFIAEEQVTDPRGGSVWLQTTKRPLIDSSGRCDHVLGICVDITARKQAEEREHDLRESLARAQRMESLGVMAGGIAHDLNNTLGPLVAYPDLIRKQIDNADALNLLSEIQTAAEHAGAIIQDMLTLARRGVYDFAPMNVNDVVGEYLGSAAHGRLVQVHDNVSLTLNLTEAPPLTLGSRPHYLQAVMNLVTNAYEAIEGKGSVTITTGVEQLPDQLTPFAEATEGEYIFFDVADTGIGIFETDINSIFEPFYSSKNLEGSGTGLGLSVVFGVMKDMNGHIDVKSERGVGSRFRIRLPLLVVQDAGFEAEGDELLSGSGMVLVVDDLASQRLLATRMLEALGYEVVTASCREEAIPLLESHPQIEIALIDMVMPNHADGLDTFREIHRIAPHVRCVLVSGFAENERVSAAMSEGALGFVKKPYTQATVGKKIRAVAPA